MNKNGASIELCGTPDDKRRNSDINVISLFFNNFKPFFKVEKLLCELEERK